MNPKHVKIISEKLSINKDYVINTIELLEDGASIPFISRYRKELTGSMDEVTISELKNILDKLVEIDKRRDTIIRSIEEQGKMTEQLRQKLENTYILSELEDLYLPYKPKRKTKASIAKEKGLEELAKIIFLQNEQNPELKAEKFINDKVPTVEEAIDGACDIIAEWISENIEARNSIRRIFDKEAVIFSKVIKGKESDAIKYGDYFNFHEPLKRCPSHRYLAMRRGEDEGYLSISIEIEKDKALQSLKKISKNNIFP